MIKCRACIKNRSKKIISTVNLPIYIWPTQKKFDLKKKCTVYKCIKCGHLQLQKFNKKTIKKFYQNESYNLENGNEKKNRIKIIEKFKRNLFNYKKILEIGGGINSLIKFLNKNNKLYLVDYRKTKKIKKKIKFLRGDFEKIALNNNYFDVVIMLHTLEHVLNPLKSLSKINKILKDKGIFILEVPNFTYYANKKFYYSIFHQHLSMFSKNSLIKLITRCNFKIEKFVYKNGPVLFLILSKNKKNKSNFNYLSTKNVKDIDHFKKSHLQMTAKVFNLFKKLDNKQKINIYGAGGSTALFLSYFPYLKSRIRYAIDVDKRKIGKKIPGSEVKIIKYADFLSNVPTIFLYKNLKNYYKKSFKKSYLLQ